jgi:hypothetical protein
MVGAECTHGAYDQAQATMSCGAGWRAGESPRDSRRITGREARVGSPHGARRPTRGVRGVWSVPGYNVIRHSQHAGRGRAEGAPGKGAMARARCRIWAQHFWQLDSFYVFWWHCLLPAAQNTPQGATIPASQKSCLSRRFRQPNEARCQSVLGVLRPVFLLHWYPRTLGPRTRRASHSSGLAPILYLSFLASALFLLRKDERNAGA